MPKRKKRHSKAARAAEGGAQDYHTDYMRSRRLADKTRRTRRKARPKR